MKGWQIFVHSVRLVFNNLDAALRLSLVPYVISGLAFLFFGLRAQRIMSDNVTPAEIFMDPSIWQAFAVHSIVAGIIALWIAVAWHRYVLLEEYPTGWVPPFQGSAIVSYFLRGLLMLLLVLVVVMVTSIVVGLAIGWMGSVGAAVTGLSAMAVAAYLFYRLCPILPSAAVGKPMSVRDAFEATKDATGTIVILVIIVLVASYIIQLPTTLGAGGGIISTVYSLVVNWISTLVGASLLTTFYGHYVEGRPID